MEVEAEIGSMLAGAPTVRCAILPSRVVRLDGAREMPLDAFLPRPLLAVAALADPAPFLDHLHGAEMEAATFPDHHPFDARDAGRIQRRAAGRSLVMTAKDAVKLRPLLPPGADAWVVEQAVHLESGADALDAALRRALREHGR